MSTTLARKAARPFALRTFAAYRIASGLTATSFNPNGFATGERIDLDGATLQEALAEALAGTSLSHKDLLVIRETGEHDLNLRRGEPLDWLHVYQIKRKSAPEYVWKDHRQQRVHRLYAEPVCTIDGRALAGLAPEGEPARACEFCGTV